MVVEDSRTDCPPMLVVGSSMVRHVQINRCRTSCHPGNLVKDVNTAVIQLLHHHPSVSTVMVHVGTNDLKMQQSEKLKEHFVCLMDSVLNTDKQCIISGPLLSPLFDEFFLGFCFT